MVVFLAARMSSKTLVIKTREMQLSRMFHLRALFSSAKDICFLVVLLSTISIIIACKPCAAKEVQNQCEFKSCRSHNGNFDPLFVAEGNVGSGLVSGNPVRLHGLEHLCHLSNAFCFPSTLSGFEDDEILTALEELDDSEVQSEVFSSGFKRKSNLSQLPYHGNFRFWGGRNISCSLYQEDTFPEFSSGQTGTRNGSRTDVSSCVNSLFGKKTSNFISFRNNESIFRIGDGLSTPLVDIKPSVLDWGHRNMYHPSIAYFTVTNLDAENVLRVHDCFSSDSQFYPCESSAGLLAPGEIASICFVFLPTRLGRVSAKLIIETSFGGLLIHARGFSVESPYLINLHGRLEISPDGRWRKSVSLFNSFDDKIHVEEVTAWLSISSGNTSRSSGSICRAESKEYSSHYNVLNAKDWLVVERGEGGKPKIGLRPHENWVVGPKKTEKLMELDIFGHFEGKIVGALCMQLLKFPNSEIDTVVVPLEVELSPENAASNTSLISLSLDALIPCNTSKLAGIALSVRNDAPYSLSVIKVTQEGESKAGFHIKSLEGVILFPSTTTIVAFINYGQLGTDEVYPSCKITVLVNSTSFNLLEIPCTDVIGVCSGCVLDSSVRNIQGINVDYGNGGERFFSNSMVSSSGIKVVNTREADELILRNWKSQATMASVSVLDKNELLFPTVLIGNYSSQWITVINPSHIPVVLQLILNSGEIIENCRIPEMLLQPSSSNSLLGNNSIAPTRYGFSIPKDGTPEAFVHPYGVATLGPIIFRPSNRCEWRSSALIRNNLSGVEWLSLQAFGGSLSLVLLEDHDPVQSLEFKSNFSSQLNSSSPETLQRAGGKTSYCGQSLTKEVYAKNTGDLPLEVVRIRVSGVECGLDGFVVHNCADFSLQPGEHAKLHISYHTDFAAATVQRDLELVLATGGILVIPVKAIIPICLIDLCRRSMFWMRFRKVMVVLLFAASFMYFMGSLLLPCITTASEPQDIGMGKSPLSSMINKFSLHIRYNWRRGERGPLFPEMNRIVESIAQEEALLSGCCEGLSPGKGNANSSSEISSPSSVLNLDTRDKPESHGLRVTVGKEKGRRRRKKKSSGFRILLSEPTSTQSGNSTPSSPKKPCRNPVLEARNPFSCAPIEQSNRSKFPEISSKVNRVVDTNALKFKCDSNFLGPSTQEKQSSTRKAASKAAIVPSSAFPSCSGGSLAPWAYCSVSNSPIAPLARAPGANLQTRPNNVCEETMGNEQNYTYDIWGDHLFGLPLTHQSRKVSSEPSLSSNENDFDSFFVRGPQTLVRHTLLQSVISEGNE